MHLGYEKSIADFSLTTPLAFTCISSYFPLPASCPLDIFVYAGCCLNQLDTTNEKLVPL